MSPYYTAYTAILIGGFIIGLLLLIRLWRARSMSGAYGLLLSVVCAMEWSFTYMMEIIRTDMAEKIFWGKLEYLGISFIALGLFIFSVHYSGYGKWLTNTRTVLLTLLAGICFAAVLTNDWHGLIWGEIRLTNQQPFGPLDITHGAGFIFVIVFQYLLLAASTVLFFNVGRRAHGLHQSQTQIMLAGMSLPWIANIIYISGLSPLPSLDLTPVALTLTNLFLAVGFLRYHFMDSHPISHSAIFNAMEDGLVILDQKERIIDVNPVAAFIFQNISSLTGQEIQKVLPNWNEWKDKNRYGEINEEIEIELEGEPSIFKMRSTSVFDHRGKRTGRILLLTEITEQKRAHEQIEEASRLKSQLLASFGHDLRSPLGAVIGYAEMIKDGSFGPTSPDQVKASSEILDSANQLLSFINNLVGQAQIETGKAILREYPFNVEEVIGPLLSTLNFHANKKGLELIQYIDPALPLKIIGDQFWLRQIVMNLVHNAVKFTETGSVTVRFIKQNETHWAIQVIDTGVGIPEDAQKRVFEAFEQVQSIHASKHGGFGLGLSIVAKLTSIMDGKIELTSETGKGSIFTLVLPLKEYIEPEKAGTRLN